MSQSRSEVPTANLDALAYRLFGALLLLGGGVLLVLVLCLLALPRVDAGPAPGFVLPGTAGRHVLAFAAAPVLAASGGLLSLLGLAGLMLARRPLPLRWPASMRARPTRRAKFVFLGGVTILVIVLALRH